MFSSHLYLDFEKVRFMGRSQSLGGGNEKKYWIRLLSSSCSICPLRFNRDVISHIRWTWSFSISQTASSFLHLCIADLHALHNISLEKTVFHIFQFNLNTCHKGLLQSTYSLVYLLWVFQRLVVLSETSFCFLLISRRGDTFVQVKCKSVSILCQSIFQVFHHLILIHL